MDKLLVTISGLVSIVGIYWFFFGKKEESMETKQEWKIVVDGGYAPSTIQISKNKPATITFIRNDPSTCLEEIIIDEFRIKEYLPLHTPVTVTLSPTKAGAYGMHCGMNMFHGRIIVV